MEKKTNRETQQTLAKVHDILKVYQRQKSWDLGVNCPWRKFQNRFKDVVWNEFRDKLRPNLETVGGGTGVFLSNRYELLSISIHEEVLTEKLSVRMYIKDHKRRDTFYQDIEHVVYLYCNPVGVYALESALVQLL